MCAEVYDALSESLCVLCCKLGFRNTAVVFQCTDSSYYNRTRGLKSCVTALYVKELLRTEIAAEACLGYGIVAEL